MRTTLRASWVPFLSLGISGLLMLGARSAPGGDEKGTAPVHSAVPALEPCISESDRARWADVTSKRGQPFQPSGIWLPPLYMANAEHSVEWIGLLWVQVTDFEAGTRTQTLPPFYISLAGPDGRTIVTPFVGSRRDADGIAGYIGNYCYRRDKLAESDVVFPLFWSFRERDMEDGPIAREAGALGPYFWQSDTSGRHRSFLPPIFWRWGDANTDTMLAGSVYWHDEPAESTLVAFPVFFAKREGNERFAIVPPGLFVHKSDEKSSRTLVGNVYYGADQEGWALAVAPLLFAGQTGDKSHVVAPPLFWKWDDKDTSTWIAGPAWRHSEPGSLSEGIFPLWFAKEEGPCRRDVVPPLLFYRSSDETTSQTLLLNTYYSSRPNGHSLVSFPLVWSFADEKSWSTAILPFWAGGGEGNERHDLVPPLLLYRKTDGETSKTWVLNTYYSSRPDGHSLLSLPLVWDFEDEKAKTRDTGVLPVWFGGRSEQKSYDVVPPLLAFRDSDGPKNRLIQLPCVWHWDDEKSSTTVIPPLLYGRSTEGDASKTFLLNTYYSSRPGGHSLLSFPLVWDFEDEAEKKRDTGVLPFWFGGTDKEKSYDVVPPLLFCRTSDGKASRMFSFPLFWRFKEGDEATTIAGPFWMHEEADSWHAGVAPLVWSGKRPDGSGYDLGLPLLWHFYGPDGNRLAVLPFFDWAEDATRRRLVSPVAWHYEDFSDHTSSTVVLGLYWRICGTETRARIAFPLYWEFEDVESKGVLTTFFPFFWRYDRAGETTSVAFNTAWTTSETGAWSFHLFPIVDLWSDRPGHSRWQVLGGLLGHESQGERDRWRIAYMWTDPSE